jgi:hypothetical protein
MSAEADYVVSVQLRDAADIVAEVTYDEYVKIQQAARGEYSPTPILHIHGVDGSHYYLTKENIITVTLTPLEDDDET